MPPSAPPFKVELAHFLGNERVSCPAEVMSSFEQRVHHLGLYAIRLPLYVHIGMDRTDYPWLHRAADSASKKAQNSLFRSLRAQLIIFFVVGLLAAIPTWFTLAPSSLKGFAVCSAVTLAAGLVIFGAARERRFDKRWFDARAVAESAKTLAWRYMMRVPPDFMAENQSADQALITELQAISASRPGAIAELGGVEKDKTQVTSRMRAVRSSSFEERKAFYLAFRVAEERDWYHDKAVFNRKRSSWWYWAVIAIQMCALCMAMLRAADFLKISIAGPLMTLAASFSAWTQAKRHDELGTTYSVAADELINLEQKVELCTSDNELLALAEDVEEAISREHTMWRARRNIAP
jgi:hypothetical protein